MRRSFVHWFASTVLLPVVRAQFLYPLATGDASVLPGAGFACITAFNANVSCGSAIGILLGDPFADFSQNVLDGLCDGTCSGGLQSYREALTETCESDAAWEDAADSSEWPVTYIADKAAYALHLACLRKSNGQYCNTWFQFGANDTDTPDCDVCYLETARQQAMSPVANDPAEMQSIYSSMSASCSYGGTPVTRTVSELVLSSPTATLDCTSRYSVRSGDSVLEVSQSQNVGSHDLMTANGLPYNLTSFSSAQSLCIRNQCETYTVRDGDTCRGIASSQNLALAELYAWNPSINGVCNNIGDMVGWTVCITNPLGDFAVSNNTAGDSASPVPAPANIAPETNTNYMASLRFLNPMVWENCTNLWLDYSYCVASVGPIDEYPGYNPPTSTSTFTFTPESSTPIPLVDVFSDSPGALVIPLANETRNDCWDYLWWNATLGTPMSCEDAAFSYQIITEQLITWNPSLSENPDNSSTPVLKPDCTISPSH